MNKKMTVEEARGKLHACPICECAMGIKATPGKHYQVYGYHHRDCYLGMVEVDPTFPTLEELVKAWNWEHGNS